ncbi:hypothetical protein ACXR2U_04370 [Jatrophihabitans sp. YIM 134969]
MPRKNRALRQAPPTPRGGVSRVESYRGEAYEVRTTTVGDGTYRCPGCDQLINAGLGHVVAWRADGDGDDRRHWHTACWANRERRTVTRRWS